MGVALFRRFISSGHPDEAEIEPLTSDGAQRLRPSLFGRFTPEELGRRVEANPELAWVVPGQNHYAIGGRWRRRQEIGEIVEISRGPYRLPLLRRLLRAFDETGTVLVVLDLEESGSDGGFYAAEGFRTIERIVEYERRGCRHGVPVSSVPTRLYRTEDLDAVLAIDQVSFPWLWRNSREEMIAYERALGVRVCVSLESDLPVGYVGMTVRGVSGHIDRLAVRREHQGRGHGSALLALALDEMDRLGVRRVTLSTQEGNHRSQALYERFGFRRGRWTYDIRGLWLREPQEATS